MGATAADEVRIRDARADERDAVHALTLRAYAEYGRIMEPAAWQLLAGAVLRALEDPGDAQCIVAERNGTLAGSVFLFPPASSAYGELASPSSWPELRLLSVAPEARRGGIGELLAAECVRRARAAGAPALGLHSSRTMSAAIRMYERLGFERVPEMDFQVEGSELVEGYRLKL